jgi:hypothetical protein
MLGDSHPDLSLTGATLPSCAIRPSDSRLIPRRSRLDSSPGMPERPGSPTTSVFDSSPMRWLPGRAIRQSPCRGQASTSSMPSTPGSGVKPPAASSWSLKTESSPSGPLALHGDAKSPRRYSKRPLLILDVRWRRMERRTAARSKNVEVASQGRSERATAATASACATGSAEAEGVISGSARAMREPYCYRLSA